MIFNGLIIDSSKSKPGVYLVYIIISDSQMKPLSKVAFNIYITLGDNYCSLSSYSLCYPRIQSITEDGVVKVFFPKKMTMTSLQTVDTTYLFSAEIIWTKKQNCSITGFSMINYTSTVIFFQLNFSKSWAISQYNVINIIFLIICSLKIRLR